MRIATPRRWDDQSGMSLVEIMVAAFVLSVGLLALASTALTSLISIDRSLGRQEATDAASALIEDLRRTQYAVVALNASDPDVAALGGCDTEYGEPLVTSNQAGAIPHRQAFGPSGRITVTTLVSWYDEQGGVGCSHSSRNVKRVRVVATWVDRGRTFTVEESTLVAPVDRGLPAPDFRVGTPEAEIAYSLDQIADKAERCVGHVLRNLGAQDGYEWRLHRIGGGPPVKSGPAVYRTANGRWEARAFFENPAQDTPLDPSTYAVPWSQTSRTAGLPAGLELTVDGPDANDWPETESRLSAGEQARLWICYRPASDPSNYGVDEVNEFEVTVASQFDPARRELITHRIRIFHQALDYFLFDDYVPAPHHVPTTQEASTPRVQVVQGNQLGIPILTMGPRTGAEPSELGTTPGLPNYDTDFTTLPGMRLKDGPRVNPPDTTTWQASRVRFHRQISPGRVFHAPVNLLFWAAPQSALDGTWTGQRRLDFRVRLQVLHTNESNVLSTPWETVVSQDFITGTWEPVLVTGNLNAGAGLTVNNNQYLRLEITCLEASSTDTCHAAFDHVDFPARLRLAVRS